MALYFESALIFNIFSVLWKLLQLIFPGFPCSVAVSIFPF